MRWIAWALLFLATSLLLTSGRTPVGRVIEVSTAEELMAAFREPLKNVTVKLAVGRYVLAETRVRVPVFACNDTTTLMRTAGLVIRGQAVTLEGPREGAIIATEADFGLYFKDCVDCTVDRITVAGETSTRVHPEPASAILARKSSVRITNCTIRDGARPAEAPTRSGGILGGDDAMLEVEFNEISRRRFGIALFEDATADVRNNLIEGLSSRGRDGGPALLVACEARMTAERNLFRECADGVQLQGSPTLEFVANIIENMHADGIASMGRGLGRIVIEQNVIYRCGGAGIAVRADGDQRASRNFIVETGRVYPRSSAIQVHGARADAVLRKNTLYGNTVTDESLDRDVPREIFWRTRRKWTQTYRNTPVGVDGRHKFHESAFLTRYGRWMN